MMRDFRCIICNTVNHTGPYCGCIYDAELRKRAMGKDDKNTSSPDIIFEMADKIGVKKDMVDTIKAVLAEHKNVNPTVRKFGVDELYFALHMGLCDSGVPDNFLYRSTFTIGRAYLFAYILGRAILKESEKKNVETVNQT